MKVYKGTTLIKDIDVENFESDFRVGIHIYSSDSDNPKTYLRGGGESDWTLINEGCLLAQCSSGKPCGTIEGGDTSTNVSSGNGTTGGTALSIAQMPSHNHNNIASTDNL